MMTAYRARSMRRRGSSTDGMRAALAQLGDLQLQIPRLGGQQPRPVPVALSHTIGAALIAARADRLGGLGLDQLLEHQLHRLGGSDPRRHQRGRSPTAELWQYQKGSSVCLLDESVMSSHRGSRRWPP